MAYVHCEFSACATPYVAFFRLTVIGVISVLSPYFTYVNIPKYGVVKLVVGHMAGIPFQIFKVVGAVGFPLIRHELRVSSGVADT